MADVLPLKVGTNGNHAEFGSGDTLGLANGGTGATTVLGIIRALGLDIREAQRDLNTANLAASLVPFLNGLADGFNSTAGIDSTNSSGYTVGTGLVYPSLVYPLRITTGTPSIVTGSGGSGTAADFNDNDTATSVSRSQGNLAAVSAVASRIFAKLDLGSSQSISKVELKQLRLSAGSTSGDAIYYSTDNTNWTIYGSTFASNTTATDIVREGVVTARYIAHVLSQVNYSTAVAISDLNVYDGNGYTEQSTSWLGASAHTAGYTNFNRDWAVDNSQKVATIGIYSAASGTVAFKFANEDSSTQFDILSTTADFSHPGGGWADYVIPSGFAVPASGTIRPGYLWRSGGTQNALPVLARAYKIGDMTGDNNSGFNNASGGCHALRVTYAGSTSNMDLRSIDWAVTEQPTYVDVFVFIEETQALTAGTDLILQGSRDGNTSYLPSSQSGLTNSTGLCRKLGTMANGISVFCATGIVVSSQAAASNLRWKVISPTGKLFNLLSISVYART